ncbi:aminotransferase class I/II-fold pyridoxal phosphate-dependent enzyme, partial [Amycolatopsis sp.]|uniref:aminotransferase class I/II-fold pyridoxal phosphate-dependent enzyme n=1 Tax=Amycolatopsis sp. TaxID=37632 RepID=UPI002D80E997
EIVDRLAGHGQLVSGGSLNHTTSLAAAVMVRDGAFDRHLAWLRPQLRLRRDALVGALREHLPASIDVVRPGGGFFVWLEAGGGHTEEELLRAADHAGLAVAAGSRFGTPARPSLRLAFTLNPPERLARAGRRLADSLTEPEPSPEWDGR